MTADNIVIPIHVISTTKLVYLLESVAVFLVLLFTNAYIILNGIKNNAFYILIYSLLFVITISFVDLYYKFDSLIDKIIEQDKKGKEKEEKEKAVVEDETSTPVIPLDDDLTVD